MTKEIRMTGHRKGGRRRLPSQDELERLAVLGLDAFIGNHYTRYNLVLIGPYAIGAAFIISSWLESGRRRWRFVAPAPLSGPSALAASDEDSTARAG